MKEENIPNPNLIFPIKNLDSITYVKPSVKNPNIIVGDFTYFADKDFEKHVTHHYDFIGLQSLRSDSEIFENILQI